MRAIKILFSIIIFISCSPTLQVTKSSKSVIELINKEHQQKAGIKAGSSYQSYDSRIYAIREKAALLFGVQTDTSKIDRFIILDMVSFEGGKSSYGEMIIDDTSKLFYKTPFLSKKVERYSYPIDSDTAIIKYLKEHRFAELETLAKEKGKTLSGSNFIYVGMYEKGMDSIYVKLIPAFMIN
ncbi:hypothetical protein [[Flexibacter] sp. ATCC 35208]|uniref:hypothetical protein n=1 Tax=[Flexibacter] sp. ATCC 35208 TaxID=1936242 RepID=UPI0009C89D61|nr:hypothetical protein [[Flexibacter] sp. ATCC 35208]OMP76232.1 hypothetical protein BW716_25985 [[Flexibacter] sp. ATCC 35208]